MAVLASASVVAVLAVNATLESLYGPPGAAAGGNFTWTLCGLSVGADWHTCYYQLYPGAVARFGDDEKGLSIFFLRQSIDNILHDPWPFIGAVFTNIRRYVGDFPRFYLSGYIWIFQMSPWRGWLMMFALAPCIVYVLRKRATPAERLFWAGLVASAVLSAAIVLGDDGWRVLHATHFPFAALFALGFVTPRDTAPAEPVAPGWRSGAAFAVGALALLLLAPVAARTIMQERVAALRSAPPPTSEQRALGGDTITGFVVFPDSQPRPLGVAAVGFSQLAALVRDPRIHGDPEPLLSRLEKELPFAFVWTPGIPPSSAYAVAPVELLQNRHVRFWRLSLDASPELSSQFMTIRRLTTAMPAE